MIYLKRKLARWLLLPALLLALTPVMGQADTTVGDENDYIIQVNTDQGSIGEFKVEYINPTATGGSVATIASHGTYTYIKRQAAIPLN